MPIALPSNVSEMVTYAKLAVSISRRAAKDPKKKLKVLDVGVGFGFWGFCLRNHVDLPNFDLKDPYNPKHRKMHITGVEIFPKYIGPHQKFIYDKIMLGNILDFVDELPEYDMVVLGDVIEHFTLKDGKRLLKKLLKRSPLVLLSTPHGFAAQSSVFGNHAETHLSGWMIEDLKDFNVMHYTITSPKTCTAGNSLPLFVGMIARGKPTHTPPGVYVRYDSVENLRIGRKSVVTTDPK